MFSLYVCDIPQNITKEELEKVFSQFNGFHEVRLAKDKNRQRIAFVDYDTPQAAEYAMSSTIGYRLSNSNKGITVRFSENSKNNQPQPGMPQKRQQTSQNSARGLQPFSTTGQAAGATAPNPPVHINGAGQPEAPGNVNGGLKRAQIGGANVRLNTGNTANATQQRQPATTPPAQSHNLYQPDHAQQMQRSFFQQQTGSAGSLDQPYLDQFAANSQFVGTLGQLGAQQPSQAQNQLFAGAPPTQQNPLLLNQQNFQHMAAKPQGSSQQHSHKTSFDGGAGGLRNPDQSIFPQPQQPQAHLIGYDAAQTSQNQPFPGQPPQQQQQPLFDQLGVAASKDFTQQSLLLPSGGQQPTQNNLATGLDQGSISVGGAGQVTAVPGQAGVDGTVAAPGSNSHQDIYNLLNNLNTMTSAMASSMINQTNQQQVQQNVAQGADPLAPHTQMQLPNQPQNVVLQQPQIGPAPVAQAAGGNTLQPMQPQQQPQPQQSATNQLLQSLISSLQQSSAQAHQHPNPEQAQQLGVGAQTGDHLANLLFAGQAYPQQPKQQQQPHRVGQPQQIGRSLNHQQAQAQKVGPSLGSGQQQTLITTTAGSGTPAQNNSNPTQQQQQPGGQATPVAKGASLKMSVVQHIQAMFGTDIFSVPKNATNTIYVEGIPVDATEREVSHIFRPFRGFKSLRLIPREIGPDEKVILCFADFENSFQTTLTINTLQGYRFDKEDILGLQFTYANKQGNQVNSHGGGKGEGARDATPNTINNNSIASAHQAHGAANSGSLAGHHSGAEASSTSKDGGHGPSAAKSATSGEALHNAPGNNNNINTNKK